MSDLYLVAYIGEQYLAIPASEAQSVIDLRKPIPVPHAPERVVGLTALRSQVLTVIDCRVAAGLPKADIENSRAIIIARDGHHFALAVDGVADVTDAISEILPLPTNLSSCWSSMGSGMVETKAGILLVVDVDAIVFGSQISRAA